MAQQPKVGKKVFNEMVDAVLEYNRTPRRELYEYPYNEFESRDLIANAEGLVRKVLKMAESE